MPDAAPFQLPPEFLARYEPLECFSHSEISETYLVKSLENSKKYVAKIYDKFFAVPGAGEHAVLEGLDHPGVPKLIECVEAGESVCVIRDYAEGTSLADIKTPVSQRFALTVGAQLCDILTYLHTRTPPVIHRDIKPSNVVVDGQNRVRLIDFGIARQYKDTAAKDTKFAATDGFAPPEQYGFKQTDALADIYALGCLLCFLLTGSSDVLEANGIRNRALAKVIKKCAAFAPGDRYKTAGAVKAALLRACNGGKWRKGAVAAAAVLLLFGGYAVGRLTVGAPLFSFPQNATAPSASDAYTFVEPLVEQAARLTLGKAEGEPITYGELETITEIDIFGTEPSLSHDWDGGDMQYGSIKSLEDFGAMKYLRYIKLQMQPFSDLSPLSGNSNLEVIRLHTNNVSDFSVLAELPRLREVEIRDTLISDYSVFEKIALLDFLCIGNGAKIKSVSELGGLSGVSYLFLDDTTLESLEGVENMPRLMGLSIFRTAVRDFSALNDRAALPRLNGLAISTDMEQYLNTLDRDDVNVASRDR